MHTIVGASLSKLIKDLNTMMSVSLIKFCMHIYSPLTRVLFIKTSNMNAITLHTGAKGQYKGFRFMPALHESEQNPFCGGKKAHWWGRLFSVYWAVITNIAHSAVQRDYLAQARNGSRQWICSDSEAIQYSNSPFLVGRGLDKHPGYESKKARTIKILELRFSVTVVEVGQPAVWPEKVIV